MSKVSKNIMEQIKDGSIKPRPRWQFVLMNIFMIIALITTIIAGGLVMSLVFLKLFNLDWDFISITGEHGAPVLRVLPLIWFLLMVILMLLAVWVFERTENGYKYHPLWLVFGSIFLSVLLGAVIYTSQASDFLDASLRGVLPPYAAMELERERLFEAPEKGFLPGRVIEVSLPTGMQLQDSHQNTWTIIFQNNLQNKPSIQNLKEGQSVMVIGIKTEDGRFLAKEIKTKRAFGEGGVMKKVILNRMDRNPDRVDIFTVQPRLIPVLQ